MEDLHYKEVYFDRYCRSCEHKDCKEDEDPCQECLDEPSRLYSHKPAKYKKRSRRIKE